MSIVLMLFMSSGVVAQTNCLKIPGERNEQLEKLGQLVNSMNNQFVAKYAEPAKKFSSNDFVKYVQKIEGFNDISESGINLITASQNNIIEYNEENTQLLLNAYAVFTSEVINGGETYDNIEENNNKFWGATESYSKKGGCKWYQLNCWMNDIFGPTYGELIMDAIVEFLISLLKK